MLHVEEPPVRLENERQRDAAGRLDVVGAGARTGRARNVHGDRRSVRSQQYAPEFRAPSPLETCRGLVHTVPDGGRAIDIGAGTADLALLIEPRMGANGQVIASDLNHAMLVEGLKKIAKRGLTNRISCLRANAEQLGFGDDTFDAVTTGFCMRNVGNLMQACTEIRRVLKPGGRFVCLEFSRPVHTWLRKLMIGIPSVCCPGSEPRWRRDHTGVYEYLPASIRSFPDQIRFSELLREAGFSHVEYHNLTGGIVAIHVATK